MPPAARVDALNRMKGLRSAPMLLLDEILAAADLHQPNGAPLYRYRLGDGHRARLREVLTAHCARHVTLEGLAAAMFCLYAADLLRHHAGAGVWAWATVTAPIGWRGSYAELTAAVERGVRWWGRPLFETANGRRFLSTLVTEGGGPLGLLRDRRSAASLRLFLRRLLIDRERFLRPAAEMVEVHRSLLAAALQRETALEVLAALVDGVAALRAKLGATGEGAPDPIAALDRSDPGWRDRLVLDLDDDTARVLLEGLLREPSPARAAARNVPVVETSLEGEEVFSLVREVVLPREPDAREFLRVFGYADDVPGRVRVLRERVDGTRIAVATAVARQGDEPTYVFERAAGARIDDPAEVHEPVALVIVAGTRELGRFAAPGGEALDDGVWIFSAAAPHRMLGVSSLRTRLPSVWVALRPGRDEAKPAADAVWQAVGSLAGLDRPRTLHQLEGTSRVKHDDVDGEIVTGAPIDDDRWYVQGRPWMGPGSFGGPAYRGLPTVYRLDGEGVSHRVSADQVTWRGPSVGGRCCGRGTLEVKRGGRVCLRSPMTVALDDIEVELRASGKADAGVVRVRGAEVIAVGVEPAPGLTAVPGRDPDAHTVGVTRAGAEVASLALTLRLQGGVDLGLRVDFPARAAGFVRGFDAPIAPRESCALERLGQIRAVARSHRPGDRFELVARVPGVTRWLRLAALPEVAGRRELVLDEVADEVTALLAQTETIDDAVELGVECVGDNGPRQAVLEVCRYERSFDLARDAAGCSLTLKQGSAAVPYTPESLRVEARPLLEPQADPRVLELAEGRWRVAWADHAPGAWMVLAWRHDRLAVRPLLVTVPAPSGSTPPPLAGLQAAAAIPNAAARAAALDARLAELMATPFDPELAWVDDHLATLHALPAVTFDVVRAVVRNPEAAVLAFLRAPRALRWRVWEAFETLPHLWETVPVVAWARVLTRLRAAWSAGAEALDPRGFEAWFDGLLAEVDGRRGTLRVQLELAAAAIGHEVAGGTLQRAHGNPIFCGALRAWLEEGVMAVRARHDATREWWPDENLTAALDALPSKERLQGHDTFQDLVVHGPLVAAAWSAGRLKESDETARIALRTALRRARGFDRQWFDEATSWWLARLFLCGC